MSQSIQQQIESLRETIRQLNRLYYVEAAPGATDVEYDRMMSELQSLEEAHPEYDRPDSPTHKVGGEPIEGFETVTHRVPMLSIENAFSDEELHEFDARILKLLEENESLEYTIEYKIDGVALSLIYENGVLVQGLTRGNGVQGDDVTHNARAFRIMVRNEVFRWVQLLSRRRLDDHEALAEVPTVDDTRRTVDDVTAAIAPYWEEHSMLPTDSHARGGAFFVLDDSSGIGTARWPVVQTIAAPEGHHEWVLEGQVDLEASREAGRAVVRLGAIRRL